MTDKFDEFVSAEDVCGAMKWISVNDGLPEVGGEYIVYNNLNESVGHDYWQVYEGFDGRFKSFWSRYGKYVTHWMPLPEPPKDE